MAFLNSDYIKVFPSARRNYGNDPFSRLMSESSLVSIINRLVDTDGFVITNLYNDNAPFEFNIFGYYFKVNLTSHITSLFSGATTGTKIYASITVSSVQGTDLTFQELVGVDEDTQSNVENSPKEYQGVTFSTSAPGSGHYLVILEKTSNGWAIPPTSQIKFNTDGGII